MPGTSKSRPQGSSADIVETQPFDDEPENEITLTAFRLLTMDLLVLFHVMNEGTINILGESYIDISGARTNERRTLL